MQPRRCSVHACASPTTFTGLSDATHTVQFRAVDAVGNIDPTPATRTFVVDAVPNNGSRSPRRARRTPRRAPSSSTITLPGPGKLVLKSASGGLIKKTTKTVKPSGKTKITIKLTNKGMKKLRADLAKAKKQGKKVGKLKVKAKVTFTPTGGPSNTEKRSYTVKLK